MSAQTSQLISAKQICETYGICRSTLWRLCQRSDFPVAQNVRTPRLWNARAVKAFFDQGHSAQQILEHYQIARGTWWKWRQLPDFPEACLPGRLARWNLNAVDAFMRERRKRGAPAPSAMIASASAVR